MMPPCLHTCDTGNIPPLHNKCQMRPSTWLMTLKMELCLASLNFCAMLSAWHGMRMARCGICLGCQVTALTLLWHAAMHFGKG